MSFVILFVVLCEKVIYIVAKLDPYVWIKDCTTVQVRGVTISDGIHASLDQLPAVSNEPIVPSKEVGNIRDASWVLFSNLVLTHYCCCFC